MKIYKSHNETVYLQNDNGNWFVLRSGRWINTNRGHSTVLEELPKEQTDNIIIQYPVPV